jgi:hypothetical protein
MRPLGIAVAFLVFAGILGTGMLGPSQCWGYTPEDPIVQKMVDRGVAYLEKQKPGGHGEQILAAYAHLKCKHDPDVPMVKKGIEEAVRFADKVAKSGSKGDHERTYIIGVAVLLLAEVDPNVYREQLEKLQKHLFEIQQAGGGFGYPGNKDGDISQTQYAMLAIWTLDRNGIPLDYAKVVKSIMFLLRVQDITGGWPYTAQDPGPGGKLIAQKKVDYSMALAGGSSILIAGDALRLWGETDNDDDPGIPGLPEAIRLYKEDTNKGRRKNTNISQQPIKNSIAFLGQYTAKNPYKRPGSRDWFYYIIYTRERFESFIEIAYGLPKDKSPAWYNEGVDALRKYQNDEGGWSDVAHTTPTGSTSFALLFLIRSTQKAIFSMGAGAMGGGLGFPKDTTNLKVDGTQIKGQAADVSVLEMLKALEEDGGSDVEGKSIPDDLELDRDPKVRRAQIDRFERLVRGSRSYQARRVAAKLLGKSDEMRVVPALIYALGDPDTPTRRYARDGLRFISRKFDGMGDLPDRPKDVDDAEAMGQWKQEVSEIQDKWRQWYRSVDPTYVFLDYDL